MEKRYNYALDKTDELIERKKRQIRAGGYQINIYNSAQSVIAATLLDLFSFAVKTR
jgi:hypothetical protein